MAAASAGALQSGIVPSSTAGGLESQMSALLQSHQHQQQQSTVVLQHPKQHPQHQQHQQVQQQHQGLQFHPSQSGPQRNSFLPRVGNESHLSGAVVGGRHAAAAGGGEPLPGGGRVRPQTLQRQLQTINAANLAPGWRRVVSNNEVVYISPSGASLRTHGQIKDYLLSPGTCKCGLPCPLRPEYFFDFNSQVPNTPLQIPLDNGLTSRSTLLCMHQRRFIETQQNLLHKEVKRRKFNDMSSSGKIITSPVPQCNSVAVYSGNVMQTSQVVGNSGRAQIIAPQLVNSNQQQQGISNVSFHSVQVQKSQHADQDGIQLKGENEKQIGSVTLSKTPPWRKNSLLQSNQNQTANVPHAGQLYSAGNERVPPLPQAHLCQSTGNNPSQGQTQTPPWQQDQVQSRFIKTRSPVINKKKPNFKDDPTGYMDHQTAILHNSMMNVVQSPDLNDTGYESVESDLSTRSGVPKLNHQQIKTEQGVPVMQQNQNVYHPIPTGAVEIKTEIKVEPPSAGRSYPSGMQTYQSQHQNPEQHVPPSSFIYSQQARIVASNQTLEMHPKQHQQMQPVTQQVIANVPSSQQIMIEKRGQFHCDDPQFGRTTRAMSQPTTTTIGGQTVTHFPNGMVQVEQNCDSMAPLKPQQQIQLQQQIQQQNILFRQNQQLQKSLSKGPPEYQYIQNVCEQKVQSTGQVLVATSQESPISSSTATSRCTPERRNNPECKGPPQVGAISTSNQSPHPCPLPAESPESSTNAKVSSPRPTNPTQAKPHQGIFAASQTSGRNTITSVTAGKTITATTSVNDKISMNLIEPSNEIHHQQHQQQQQQQQQHHHQHQAQKLTASNVISASGIQIQPVVREPSNQLIMTSTGQLIVVPAQSNKSSSQVIINNPGGSNLVMNNQPNMLINQQSSVVNNSQLIGNSVDVLSNQSNASNIIQNSGNGLHVIQNSNLVQSGQNIIQSPNNLITSNSSNFIVNSAGNMQPLILNNSNLIQQNGQNLIAANATNIIQQNSAGSGIMTTSNAQKVLNNQNIITNQSSVINNQVLGGSGGGIIGQQTVVLNTLPNGYVIQPNFTTATVDGQVVGQIVNQENGNAYLQAHQQRQIILTSPDSKRKGKKRKSSASSSPSTPSSLSPQQSPTANVAQSGNPQGTMVQITPQYSSQGFQISPGIQGIVVNKNTQSNQPQQQILFQNGQIIQPMNLIGQQLLVPAGLVVTPETTLVQIQNVGPCGGLIAPQGMMLRAPSPQNKNFLSPNAGGQQFIVGGGSQVSPLGQIYTTPVGLVVPQSNSGTATFVQQNTAIVQQQQQQQQQQQAIITNSSSPDASTDSSLQSQNSASPPDTTTHSPRSPERPPSEKSGGSDMVQCVSSSEPDSVVSPAIADSAQSPTTTDCERSGSVSYQVNVYKPSDAKIRKIETPTQFSSSTTPETSTQIKPDSHESPTNSPTASATSTTSSGGGSLSGGGPCGCGGQQPSFSIGELVWGAARGHPAWPGKILSPPEGICTPSDSTWVQWFGPGGRPNVELVAINSLKSLSEGLEAHHKAQKDTRKSRKLNSQLERAIQEAMAELDRMSSTVQPATPVSSKNRNRGRQQQATAAHQRSKPVKIAPAPPCANSSVQQIRQQTTITQVTHHQHQGAGPQQASAAPSK